ncbi:hypothetical protein E5720_07765 [Rhodococcus sp. PAMC28707]|uniref:hypothetical protein n=1 Tax=unclassified Rhodococcus (in: high G+C Gram-positive bacteria) TaxID=192944 RepID=UPI00109DF984|nr:MULTISPECIES: hypothetical protein [unclassified Rhodococcus (in: high G+C Gram-positive bacteria)]QCB49886.1 hypothetical protein E5769_06250 [Rhodococcus sp. PAMC28705]QCB58421.1 hypothetical protein E5720_07765 [Rhodococcus sp. PAMC28707]
MNGKRALAHVTLLAGAFVAALTLTTTVSHNFAFFSGGDRLDVFFDSAASGATLGAIVAVVIATVVSRTRSSGAAAGFGIVLLGVVSLLQPAGELQLRALAAGLILGGVAALTGIRERRTLQCALVVGVVSGAVMAGPLESEGMSRRYADYLEPAAPQTYLTVALGVFAVLLAVSAWMKAFEKEPVSVDNKSRVLLVGIVIPVAGLVLYWLFQRSVWSLGTGEAMQNRWLLGLVVIPLLVGAAFALPAASGAVVLAALAYLGAGSTGSFEMSTALVFVALLVAGSVVGWRWRSPMTGFALLAVVAATGLFTDPPLDWINMGANVFVLPFAVGLLYASLLPTDAPAATMSVTTPIAVSIPIVAEFGWTAYTPLSTIEPKFSPTTWMWTSTAVSVGSVLAAGAAFVVLRHTRRGSYEAPSG